MDIARHLRRFLKKNPRSGPADSIARWRCATPTTAATMAVTAQEFRIVSVGDVPALKVTGHMNRLYRSRNQCHPEKS